MNVFLQQLINGLSIGSIYALMAVGYSLVYSILNFSNFAHGGVIMLGAYFGLYAVNLIGAPFLGAIIIAALCAGLVAVTLEKVAYTPSQIVVHSDKSYSLVVSFAKWLAASTAVSLSPNTRYKSL